MPRQFLPTMFLATLVGGLAQGGEATAPSAEQVRFFEAKIRPTLADHCQKCHGPSKAKAGLRLDSKAAVMAGGDSGPVVVPGNPSESLLIAAINHREDGPKMPPSKKLPQALIADLTRWVQMGAPWPGDDPAAASASRKAGFRISAKDREHWAFRPLHSPVPPAVKDGRWVVNPIDAFVLAGLEAEGLRPNPPASKLELIRRAAFDLTGLPPSVAEVEAFLADDSPRAVDAVIDRLLDSPRYGEKWGRHWLDLVRFAETNSYERDNPKPSAWRYRDYVIRSFNADKPYDRFIREQLAGDEIAGDDSEALIATGYYRLGIWDDEPTDRDQARYDGLDDIVATTGQVFLGLTVDCARCHDHKLDPIPQKDYYRLVAFFQNINHFRNGGPTDELPIGDAPGSRRALDAKLAGLARSRDEVRASIDRLEDRFLTRLSQQRGVPVRRADLDDLRYRFYRDTWERLPEFDALKFEEEGRPRRPLFDLAPRTRDEAFGFVFEGVLIVPRDGTYAFSVDSDDGARLIIAGRPVVEYDGIHRLGQPRRGQVELHEGRVPIRLEYFQKTSDLGLNVSWSGPGFDARRLSGSAGDPAEVVDVVRLLRAEGRRVLGSEGIDAYRRLRARLREIEAEMQPGTALCVTEAGPNAPETRVLLRGNPHVPGDRVEPGFLQVLGAPAPVIPTPPPGARTSGRRTVLADWIASPDNPLTARVIANRVWQYHFGRGIVRSSSNFGLQGDRPTHPELLDWLASELVRQGWRLKSLHRLIMTSNVYKMSSRANEHALARDPANDRLWRVDMRRLEAEEIRDAILAVSGDLNLKMYGPGTYPEIPPEVLAGQSVPGKGWGKSLPEEEARRSVYIHVKRSLLSPILESFDIAETDRSTPSRFSTTQPTQALAMLNSAFLHRQAARFAARLRREAGVDVRGQVALALGLATSRVPTDAEVRRGLGLIETLQSRDGASADAALETFCLVVLNLNEFIYLD